MSPKVAARPVVLSDGTYATQAAVSAEVPVTTSSGPGVSGLNLRSILLSGDAFLGSVISVNVTKLLLRLREIGTLSATDVRRHIAKGMLLMVSILRLGESQVTANSYIDRVCVCTRGLSTLYPSFFVGMSAYCAYNATLLLNCKDYKYRKTSHCQLVDRNLASLFQLGRRKLVKRLSNTSVNTFFSYRRFTNNMTCYFHFVIAQLLCKSTDKQSISSSCSHACNTFIVHFLYSRVPDSRSAGQC